MKALAVIPARKGSKGIPHKNTRDLMGKPLIEWSIRACLASDVDRLVVSTNDEVVMRICDDLAVEYVNRPDQLSTDWAASEWAVTHAIESIGWDGENVLMVQCTSPLTQPEDINGVIRMMDDHDSVFTAVRFHGFIWDHKVAPVNHCLNFRQMRQERNEFIENGAIYGMKVEGLEKHKCRFFGKIGMYEMPEERCLEIDHPFHLTVAEMIMRKKIHTNSPKVRAM